MFFFVKFFFFVYYRLLQVRHSVNWPKKNISTYGYICIVCLVEFVELSVYTPTAHKAHTSRRKTIFSQNSLNYCIMHACTTYILLLLQKHVCINIPIPTCINIQKHVYRACVIFKNKYTRAKTSLTMTN